MKKISHLLRDGRLRINNLWLTSSMTLGLRSLLDGVDGQTLVFTALCLMGLTGIAGLAVDVGQIYYAKQQLQQAADAAAVAGALEIAYCGGTASCTAMQNAAQNALVENGLTGSSLLANCGTGTGTTLELKVNNPPCALGGADPNTGKNSYVEVVLSKPQTLLFAQVVGLKSVPIQARSEASRAGRPNCVYALDPAGLDSVIMDANSNVVATCGIVDESNNGFGAMLCNIGATVSAAQIRVAGTLYNFCSLNPTPQVYASVPVPADPLASLPKPTVPACGTSVLSPYHGSNAWIVVTSALPATFYPDKAYCGGITIQAGATATFMPGTYALTTKNSLGVYTGPGGIYFDLGSTVTGSGVTFYNYGPFGTIWFQDNSIPAGGVRLSAPTSGTYAGLLLFQDPQNTQISQIHGTTAWNTSLEGYYYFPTAKVYYENSGTGNYNGLIAYDIEFQSFYLGSSAYLSSFKNTSTTLANGSSVLGNGAVLVQ